MTLTTIIIAAILIIHGRQVYLDKSKPVSGFYFYLQLLCSIALIFLVWINREPQTKIAYPILLTAVATISIMQCYLSYRRRKTVVD